MEFNNNNVINHEKCNSYLDWVTGNQHNITTHLIAEGVNFINHHAEESKYPLFDLQLDDKWHYLDKKKKKESYKGTLHIDAHGVPHLSLKYYCFKHGTYSERFDSKSCLKELWRQFLTGKKFDTQALVKKQRTKLATVPEDSTDYVALHKKYWDNFANHGTSLYLKRKGLDNFDIPGIRYGSDLIAVKIIDTENHFYGLQRIFDDSIKKFTKGMEKKGHFALIGAHNVPSHICILSSLEGTLCAPISAKCPF